MKRLIVSGFVALLGCLVVATSLGNLSKHRIPGVPTSVVRADGGCSAASLNGAYAVEGQGTIVASLGPAFPTPPFPFGEASRARFNGDGTGSASATVNFGGVVLNAVPVTITYAVNTDCTGNLTVNTSLGLSVHEAFVVVGGGQRFITTETDPFAVVQRRGERLGD